MRSLVRDAVPDYVRQVYDEVERQQRISNELESGEVLNLKEIRKMMSVKKVRGMFERAAQIGTVVTAGDFMKERRDAEFRELLETMRKNSAEINVAVEVLKARSRTLALKTPRVDERKKTVEKPMVLELPRIALHGNLNRAMQWRVLQRLVREGC